MRSKPLSPEEHRELAQALKTIYDFACELCHRLFGRWTLRVFNADRLLDVPNSLQYVMYILWQETYTEEPDASPFEMPIEDQPRRPLTYEEHRQVGRALAGLRTAVQRAAARFFGRYPKAHPIHNAFRRAEKAIARVQSKLDDIVCEFRELSDRQATTCYYGHHFDNPPGFPNWKAPDVAPQLSKTPDSAKVEGSAWKITTPSECSPRAQTRK